MLKALIADDDSVFAQYIQKCVDWGSLGVGVEAVASNGKEAIRLSAELMPDIVVMDVEMPGATGLECVEQIRAARRDCEILLVTGHEKFQYAQFGAKYGVSEILLKPTTKHSLESALKNAVDRHWAKRISDCAMRCATGQSASEETLLEIREDCPADAVPALCRDIVSSVRDSDETGIQDAVTRYLLAVTSLGVPNDRLFWLHVFPVYLCIALLREGGAAESPEPFDDLPALMERIQSVCFGEGAHQMLCELCARAAAILSLPQRGLTTAAEEALRIIRQNYSDPKFSIQLLAVSMHFHEGYLRRVFKAAFGKSPGTVLKETRMNEAKRLFSVGCMQIQQVAQLVGFEDASYFSKCFKQHFGYAPSECLRSDKT